MCNVEGDADALHIGEFKSENESPRGVLSLYNNGQFRKFCVQEGYQGKGIVARLLHAALLQV